MTSQTNGTQAQSGYKIEKGIPTPEKPVPGGKYPFAQMQVGDSFVVKIERRNIQLAQDRTGYKFSTRSVEADAKRIWRVS